MASQTDLYFRSFGKRAALFGVGGLLITAIATTIPALSFGRLFVISIPAVTTGLAMIALPGEARDVPGVRFEEHWLATDWRIRAVWLVAIVLGAAVFSFATMAWIVASDGQAPPLPYSG